MKKIFTIIIVVGLLLSYFTYVSYFSLDVTTYSLNTDKVNGDIKVVMISDLHDTHCLIQEKIVEK